MARVRKSHVDLTDAEWTAFINAVNSLRASTTTPNYDYFSAIHSMDRHEMQAHEAYTFLPWHREYLMVFEDALQSINADVTIPYWDWTTNPELPQQLSDATAWGVTRAMKAGDKISPKRKDDVALALSKTTYAAFHDRINGPHGAVHVQIGGIDEASGQPLGEMADIDRSPRDVLFWLHHAYLDKLWHDWSVANPGRFPPDGRRPRNRVTARLLPTDAFSRTSRQVFLISDLGYSYG